MKRIQNKLRGRKGFTLVELLATIIVMLLVTEIISMTIQLSTKYYTQSVRNSESQTICGALSAAVQEELQYATKIQPKPGSTPDASGLVDLSGLHIIHHPLKTGTLKVRSAPSVIDIFAIHRKTMFLCVLLQNGALGLDTHAVAIVFVVTAETHIECGIVRLFHGKNPPSNRNNPRLQYFCFYYTVSVGVVQRHFVVEWVYPALRAAYWITFSISLSMGLPAWEKCSDTRILVLPQ